MYMSDTTIRLPKETVQELWEITGKLQRDKREKVTIAETVQELIRVYEERKT